MEKLPRCCAIPKSRLTQRQDDLRKAAAKAARLDARNRNIDGVKADIAHLKQLIEEDKKRVAEHEAEHCVDVQCENLKHYELRA